MKVAIIVDQPHWTGVGIYAVELYQLFKSKLPELKLIYVGAVEDDLNIYEKIDYLCRENRLLLRPTTIKKNYKKLINDDRYKDYLFHYAGTDFFALKKRPGIITIHDLIRDKVFTSANLSIKNFLNALERYRKYIVTKSNFNHAYKIVTISRTTYDDVLSKLGVDSVVISQWINFKRFNKRDSIKAKEKLNLDPNLSYVLSVGNNRKNKRLDLIRKIADSLPNTIKMLKIGAPIVSNGCINLENVSDDSYPFYFNASICYLHISDNEGLGIPLLEALGSELPVVCRKIPINVEILKDAGIYVPEEDIIGSTIKAIINLKENQVRDDIIEAIRTRRNALSPTGAIEKYLNLYKDTERQIMKFLINDPKT